MTEKASSFGNWKLQKQMQVAACVLVDCNFLTVTPDSFLSFFILVFSLPTTYITCSLTRMSIFKTAVEYVCNVLIFLFKLNTHCQIVFFS